MASLIHHRQPKVKNKTPAPIQITAEYIIGGARQLHDSEFRPQPTQKITDSTELSDYRFSKRKHYEDSIRRGNKNNTSVWIQYAQWEEESKDLRRARSVFERALEIHSRDHTVWLKYAELEMRNKCLHHARNVFERAVTQLPRVDQLWYKYVHMEEMLGNMAGARQIFERWIMDQGCQPNSNPSGFQAHLSYIMFEIRYNEIVRARNLFSRFVECYPSVSSVYIKFAKFEVKNGEIDKARSVYENAVEKLGDDGEESAELFAAFAEFEESCKEIERARCVYKYGLDRIPNGRAEDLCKKFVAFEKKYGDREGIEDAVVGKRRVQYEEEVKKNPCNYDSWFDYIRLEESGGKKERVREVYERAVANVPPAEEKRYWQRYICIWINYALYEELDAQDMDRARQVYKECLKLIPHKKFSFGKIWLMAAEFEIRQMNLAAARKILGNAIEVAPKDKIFKKYIEIELQLGNMDRCRALYAKYLDWAPGNCYAWIKFAEFEMSLGETERTRAIFELATEQHHLDMPELLWKAYIDFEITEREYANARALYEKLLIRTTHYKVWESYAKFEAFTPIEEGDEVDGEEGNENLLEQKKQCLGKAREVFERALHYYRENAPEQKEERAMLLEEWLNVERKFGRIGDTSLVEKKLARKIKKRKEISSEEGPTAYEEFYEYIFPEDTSVPNFKILEAAYNWKKQKMDSCED
ncbi:hypothetical protein MKW94_017870 [Papaver nudicaule]|uniref:Pre-mRNA-splicing factor Syf1-like N-terminal HAT-repeats domain-containing protein n=1 Tax=Papaver nudicaule TaxID=74823 RepID=A0AA41SCA1_PAPNU|nr:hypothetical protein [Papaver nudicaule]